MAIFFKLLSQKYTNKAFWVPNLSLSIFFSHEIIQLDKFEGADFKYDNIFLKFQPKSTKIRHCWSKFWNFYFCTKLCSKTNSWTVIWIMTIIFSYSRPKIRKLGIFGSKFKDFYFAVYFGIRKIWGCWFQIWEWFFRILDQKYRNKAFFSPKDIFFKILHEASNTEKFEGTD